MSPKLEKNQSPILVKFLMIHNNSPKKNHQNGWHFLVHKMSLNLEQNYSQNKVKKLVIQRICLQKCHQNWWKSDGITRICADFVENRDGIIYASSARFGSAAGWWPHTPAPVWYARPALALAISQFLWSLWHFFSFQKWHHSSPSNLPEQNPHFYSNNWWWTY